MVCKHFIIKNTLTALLIFSSLGKNANAQQREKQTLNSGWEFVLNDEPELSTLQNTSWQKINLPHTWNARDIIDDTIGYHQGIGWYKKQIQISVKDSQKHLELFFEGACNKSTVFC